MEILKVKLTGIVPLVVHCGQLANPMNPIVKAIKVITGKRKKTDEDILEIARLEWLGSLYLNADKQYVLPGVGIESAVKDAAKMSKLGRVINRAVMVPADPLIEFPMMKLSPDALWEREEHRLQKMMKVGTSKVLRTVPQFPVWSVDVELSYLPDQIDRQTLLNVLGDCGRLNGMFEYRPHWGRFQVKDLT